ncbi:hypothetical protein PAMP_020783 [Pampus punctatissimus]
MAAKPHNTPRTSAGAPRARATVVLAPTAITTPANTSKTAAAVATPAALSRCPACRKIFL